VDLADIEAISAASAEADGIDPLDEGAWRRLRHHGDELTTYVEPGRGFSAVDGDVVHLVVAPEARSHGLGGRLLASALDGRGGPWQAWSHGDHPAAAALARATGFERTRALWVMRRSLHDLTPLAILPEGVRTFAPGDEDELVRVNAAAFAHHPEQGNMDRAELAERMAEPWFDPEGLLLAVDGDRLLGFHWTKLHHYGEGEVYVVGIDPAAQGAGLGRALTLAGLHHLAAKGARRVHLYVESDNAAALRIYSGLGFTHTGSDTHTQYHRPLS
jgi:mycothiol synthase